MRKLIPLFAALAFFIASSAIAAPPVGKRYVPSKRKAQQAVQKPPSGPTSLSSSPVGVPPVAVTPAENARQFEADMNRLASGLSVNLKGFDTESSTVVVTSFVPVGNYEKTEPFGRLMADQMTSALMASGFKVNELRKSPQLLMKDEKGIFSLSDRLANINESVQTDLILAGTYAMVGGEILVNAYLYDAAGRQVVSSSTVAMDIYDNDFIRPLLEPLMSHEKEWSSSASKMARGLAIREPVREKTDSSSKVISLKLDKVSLEIARNLKRKGLNKIIVSTYVDVDRFYTTNTFGRFITERLMDGMSRNGFDVIEVRAAKELMVQPNIGEMALTRDVDEMLGKYHGQAMIIGTYKRAGDTVIVHTRLIVTDNQEVVSVASMEMTVKEDDKFMQAMFDRQLDRTSFHGDSRGDGNE
ncbi:MAG: FlgO family outer membrane protein [Nitrospinota bacterium]